MFDPQPYLAKLARLLAAAEAHNTDPRYIAAGYPKLATFCATITYRDGKPPYIALFNAGLEEGEALDRFYVIDSNARLAVHGRLQIEVAALR